MKSYQKTGIQIDNDIVIENGFDELNINRYKVYKSNNNIFYAKELLYEMRGNNLALNIKGEVIGKGSSSEQTINYHYDTDGRLKYHSLLGSYNYDGLGRLTSYQYNGTTKTYEYDGYGNITKMGDINISYSSNRKDRINTITKDGVTSNVVYDSLGNMTSYLDRNFTFEGRRLVSVQKNGYCS